MPTTARDSVVPANAAVLKDVLRKGRAECTLERDTQPNHPYVTALAKAILSTGEPSRCVAVEQLLTITLDTVRRGAPAEAERFWVLGAEIMRAERERLESAAAEPVDFEEAHVEEEELEGAQDVAEARLSPHLDDVGAQDRFLELADRHIGAIERMKRVVFRRRVRRAAPTQGAA